jgi:signal transduction histidine kinase
VFNEGMQIIDGDKLWDVFYRDDKVRNSKDNSTGMGLAICKQILTLHKYKFGIENKPNGVAFYFIAK